ITYVNIAKFTGNSYRKIGFKTNLNNITRPNYIWINFDTYDILSRYQTQKHILIDKGYGTQNDTEDTIMTRLGYIKIYDSGNLKMTWTKEIQDGN
ncbi:MAG: hypothetical protein J6A59_09350, partial [Lachnospiraceae bacterium]|nr:hypothetical protein [Lachnospiraceae bacterium]